MEDFQEDPVSREAHRVFGIRYLFPWQRLVIANILDAVNASHNPDVEYDELYDEDGVLRGRQIVLLPTGAGKSLCFQIPALLLQGPTLVIYPLLALMGDQLRRMHEGGLKPAIFRGGQSREEREAQFRRLAGTDGQEKARLIIANPEVLAGDRVKDRIAAAGCQHIAIDEAHCVSEWGDSFRPAYLELKNILTAIPAPAVTAFTATASSFVLSRISEILFDGQAHIVHGDSNRPNIRYSVRHAAVKDVALIRELSVRERPAIVFCSTRGRCERIALLLREVFNDRDIRFYHAGLERSEKTEVESWFLANPRGILVATVAYGMGVDARGIRTVIHRDPSPTVEAYIQEAGRGGRDGKEAEAILLWNSEDARRIATLAGTIQGERAAILGQLASGGRCRREVLLEALGDGERGTVCTGCDICDGTAEHIEKDIECVFRFIQKNNRILSRAAAEEILYMQANRNALLRNGTFLWRHSDITAMIDALEKQGRIGEYTGWLRKGALYTIQRKG